MLFLCHRDARRFLSQIMYSLTNEKVFLKEDSALYDVAWSESHEIKSSAPAEMVRSSSMIFMPVATQFRKGPSIPVRSTLSPRTWSARIRSALLLGMSSLTTHGGETRIHDHPRQAE